jgi:hypothetical protein
VTNTIGDKDSFKLIGELSSVFLDFLDVYLRRAEVWHLSTRANRRSLPRGIPDTVAPLFVDAIGFYLDPDGPAVCFRITGSRAKQIKEVMGRKGSWDRVYWFGGTT